MLVVRTSESGTDALGQLVAPQQTVRLYNLALAVNPLRFYRVEPRALLGQQTGDYPHSSFAEALLNFPVMRADPPTNLAAYVPTRVVSQIRTNTFLPAASSFSVHHERKRVVIPLTGRPSTKRNHVLSSSGT
jgi:hypothetical protein